MKKEFLKGSLSKTKDGGFEFIASDETLDRHGDSIPLDSWDLKNFLRAPRMLIDHWHSVENIVGKWIDIHIDRDATSAGLKMTANFHNITELSREVHEMVKKGFLDTVSVGFIPKTVMVDDGNGGEREEQVNELIEVSLVTVPANPNAVLVKSIMEKKESKNEKSHSEINRFLGVDKSVDTETKEPAVEDTEINKEIKPTETRKDTPEVKGKSTKGRSLSIKERKLRIAKASLKQAGKAISFALYEINKK